MPRVVERNTRWYVEGDDGEPVADFATEAEAQQRMALGGGLHARAPVKVETMRTRRPENLYSVVGGRLSSRPADCWDQVAKFGRFLKRDQTGAQRASIFNLEHLGQFLDNFAAQRDWGWADFNHDFGEALAYYDAAALVIDGHTLRLVTKAGRQVPPPTVDDVRDPETGALLDGVFWHRFEITPRGQEKLPNLRHTSPGFSPVAEAEDGTPIGYAIANVAWCSGPFLDGMKPLEMTLFSLGGTMDPEMMKRYGLDEKSFADVPEPIKAAMKKFAEECDQKTADAEARLKKFVSVGGELTCPKCGGHDVDDVGARTGGYELRCKACGKSWEDRDFSKMQKLDPEEEKAKVEMSIHLGGKATWRGVLEHFTAQRHTTIDKAELVPLKTKVAELEQKLAEREKGERESAIVTFAREAIAAGSWDPSDEAGLIEFRRSAPDAAAKNVEKNRGRWKALQTFTVGGHPVGKGPGAASAGGKSHGRGAELVAAAEEIVAKDPELLKLSRTNRAEAMTMAMDLAYAKDPSLYR